MHAWLGQGYLYLVSDTWHYWAGHSLWRVKAKRKHFQEAILLRSWTKCGGGILLLEYDAASLDKGSRSFHGFCHIRGFRDPWTRVRPLDPLMLRKYNPSKRRELLTHNATPYLRKTDCWTIQLRISQELPFVVTWKFYTLSAVVLSLMLSQLLAFLASVRE